MKPIIRLRSLAHAVPILAITALLSGCGGTPTKGARFLPTQSASRSPSPTASSCHLRAVEVGFSTDPNNEIDYATIIENPCSHVAIDNQVTVQALDSAGRSIQDGSFYYLSDTRKLPTILPGQKVAVAAVMSADENKSFPKGVKSLRVKVEGEHWQTKQEFDRQNPHWPTVRAIDVRVSDRDNQGSSAVTFSLKAQSGTVADLSNAVGVVVLRDHAGELVAGTRADIYDPSRRQRVGAWLPPSADPSKTEVYVSQP